MEVVRKKCNSQLQHGALFSGAVARRGNEGIPWGFEMSLLDVELLQWCKVVQLWVVESEERISVSSSRSLACLVDRFPAGGCCSDWPLRSGGPRVECV